MVIFKNTIFIHDENGTLISNFNVKGVIEIYSTYLGIDVEISKNLKKKQNKIYVSEGGFIELDDGFMKIENEKEYIIVKERIE